MDNEPWCPVHGGLDAKLIQARIPVSRGVVRIVCPECPPCPRCGVTDPDEPCQGDQSHGGKPLPYRHKGRVPPAKGNPRLNGPNVTPAGQWDTEANVRPSGEFW